MPSPTVRNPVFASPTPAAADAAPPTPVAARVLRPCTLVTSLPPPWPQLPMQLGGNCCCCSPPPPQPTHPGGVQLLVQPLPGGVPLWPPLVWQDVVVPPFSASLVGLVAPGEAVLERPSLPVSLGEPPKPGSQSLPIPLSRSWAALDEGSTDAPGTSRSPLPPLASVLLRPELVAEPELCVDW